MNFEPEYFEGEERDGFYVQPLMKRVWAAQLEVLEEIDRICARHGIKYIAQWGTLLGAIRHRGFIPWDDDIDLAMLREDYERFIYYAKRELPEGWLLYDHNDKGFNDLLVRVINSYSITLDRKFLDRFHGCPYVVGVDIFPMDHIPNDKEEEEILINMMSMLDYVGVNWEKYQEEPEGVEPMIKELEEITGYHFDRSKSMQRQILHLADRASAMYWDEDSENVAMVYRLAAHPENKIPVSCFDKIIRVPFENTTVPVIEDYDLMLKKYFGDDYMNPQIWTSHDYPFFKKQITNLRDFYHEYGMNLPQCFDIICGNEDKPLVSVIIPCYNVEKYIDRCLESLMCQTVSVTSLEIICIDDASSDGTLDKLKKWEQKLGNIMTVVQCESNGKQGTARNIGIEFAKADYIAFIDGDDWVEKDYFEKLYRPIQIDNYDVVTCSYQRDASDALTYFQKRETGKESRSLLVDSVEKRKIFFNLYSCGHQVWGKIIRREVLIENRIFFPEQITYEDGYFEALLHFYVQKVYLHEEQLYHYYVNNSSTILALNADHHTDWLTVQLINWKTWRERGLLDEYREELEYEFLWSCYLGFFKLLAFRFDHPSYSLFKLAKEITLSYVPDYTKNKYLEEGFTEFQKLLLETLLTDIKREEFLQIIDMIKMHGV